MKRGKSKGRRQKEIKRENEKREKLIITHKQKRNTNGKNVNGNIFLR